MRTVAPPSPLAGHEKTWRMLLRHPLRYLRALEEVRTTGRYGDLWDVYDSMGRCTYPACMNYDDEVPCPCVRGEWTRP